MSSTSVDMEPFNVANGHSQVNHNATKTNDVCEKPKTRTKNVKESSWGWLIVFCSFMTHVITDGIIYAYGVLAPEYVEYFGITRSQVGWLGSILVAVTLATGTLAGYLCKIFSCRTVSIAGSVISMIGFGAPYFYPRLWFLYVSSSVICGIGFGMVYMPSILIVNDWFDKKRSLAIGIALCGAGIGTLVFSSVFEMLLQSVGWQMTMLISSGLLVILIPCCLSFSDFDVDKDHDKQKEQQINSTKNGHKIPVKIEVTMESLPNVNKHVNIEENAEETHTNVDINKESKTGDNNSKSLAVYIEMMKNPVFILYLMSVVLSCIAFNAPYMFMKDRALQAGLSASQGASLISSFGIGNCVGRVIFGFMATLKGVNRFHLYNITRLNSGVILIASWILTHYYLMMGYTAIYGLMSGAVVTLTSIILGDIFGQDKLHITFGISLFFQGTSMLIGPPLVGLIFDATKSFDIAFAVCGTSITLSVVILYLAYISRDFRKIIFHY